MLNYMFMLLLKRTYFFSKYDSFHVQIHLIQQIDLTPFENAYIYLNAQLKQFKTDELSRWNLGSATHTKKP
jgi:hypothetical protein